MYLLLVLAFHARKNVKRYDLAKEIAHGQIYNSMLSIQTFELRKGESWKWRKLQKPLALQLTGVEGDFADHNPSRGEAESQFDELADSMVQLDCDISRLLEDLILHVRIYDGIARVVFAADAEHDADLGEYLEHKEKYNVSA